MTGFLDTSTVIRYLMRDDPARTEQAIRIIDGDTDLYVTGVVLHEVAHVLRSVYQVPRTAIVDTLLGLLQKQNIATVALDKDKVKQGLLLCRPSGRVSFGDALLWAALQPAATRVLYSFDRRFPGDSIERREDLP